MDPVNIPAKFEVPTFSPSWDNSDCSFGVLHLIRIVAKPAENASYKISVCQNVALKECFYRTDVDYLCYEYNVNFSLSLSVINHSVYSKFGNICGMF